MKKAVFAALLVSFAGSIAAADVTINTGNVDDIAYKTVVNAPIKKDKSSFDFKGAEYSHNYCQVNYVSFDGDVQIRAERDFTFGNQAQNTERCADWASDDNDTIGHELANELREAKGLDRGEDFNVSLLQAARSMIMSSIMNVFGSMMR